jgi:hypothetical protein
MYDQAKKAEIQNMIETNTGPYKHYGRMFLQPSTRGQPKSPPLPLYPDLSQPGYETIEYYPKQDRLVMEYNYNYEQYKDYSRLFNKKMSEDKKNTLEERKLMKYLYNVNNNETNGYLKKMHMTRSMLREDPRDKGLDITGVKILGKKKPKKTINMFRAGTLDKYDAWRCTDRKLFQMGREIKCRCKLSLAPCLLVKAFGWPTIETPDNKVSGEYTFEDINLDLFVLYEYNQTNLEHEDRLPVRSLYKVISHSNKS